MVELFHFVALQVTDQMPSDRRRIATDCCLLDDRFLHFILAHIANPGVPGRFDGIRSMRLGDRDQPNRLRVPATAHGFRDCRSNLCDSFRQRRKWHNTLNYQRLPASGKPFFSRACGCLRPAAVQGRQATLAKTAVARSRAPE